jgi:hypothetical protein
MMVFWQLSLTAATNSAPPEGLSLFPPPCPWWHSNCEQWSQKRFWEQLLAAP